MSAVSVMIYARNIMPGDVTTGSRQRVLGILSTAGPRIRLELETQDGAVRVASWNKSTRLHVRRDLEELEACVP
jgi:hypothetical protein